MPNRAGKKGTRIYNHEAKNVIELGHLSMANAQREMNAVVTGIHGNVDVEKSDSVASSTDFPSQHSSSRLSNSSETKSIKRTSSRHLFGLAHAFLRGNLEKEDSSHSTTSDDPPTGDSEHSHQLRKVEHKSNSSSGDIADSLAVMFHGHSKLKRDDEEETLEVLREVVRKCTDADPGKRPAAADVYGMLTLYL